MGISQSSPEPSDESAAVSPLQVEEPAPPTARAPRQPLKIGPAFWTVTGIISLIVNAILIALLISLAGQLFGLKRLVQDQLLGGLYTNFVRMDQAHIRTTIPVNTEVPAKFNLPLKTNTIVVLTEDTVLENARVARLSTGGLTITDAPATIVLAQGTQLPVALDLSVPVDQMIPVSLNVNVDIPLSQTDLHAPFVGLQEVVRPYYRMLEETPDTWAELLCGPNPGDLCKTLLPSDR
jgi:hypothetical protein